MSARPAQRTTRPEAQTFYREAVPRQFNRTIEMQRSRAQESKDPAALRLLEEMEAVRAAIRVEVAGGAAGGPDLYRLEIARGEMRAVEGEGGRAPFMILTHAVDQFEPIREQCGDSVLGFLGAMAGLGDEMKLTRQRVRSLRELEGSLLFEVLGSRGFRLIASFGIDPPEIPPRAAIQIEQSVFDALKAGELNAQDAFFEEKMQVEGDLELAIGVALAALSPD